MQDFRKLEVWYLSHQLTIDIYNVTKSFPKTEIFGMTSQMRRASSSIPANIAEGCGRESDKELHRFLHIANGSANELSYFLELSKDLLYLPQDEYDRLQGEAVRIKKMLWSLIERIKKSIS